MKYTSRLSLPKAGRTEEHKKDILLYGIYNILLITLFLLTFPISLAIFIFSRGLHRERWGFFPRGALDRIGQRPSIWLHAASVGEVRLALTLLNPLAEAFTKFPFVISTTTIQGRSIAASDPRVAAAILAPLDLPWIIRRVIRRIRPKTLLVAETELWPNLLRISHSQGIPIILFNGRISARSIRSYRLLRPFFQRVLANIDLFCVKSPLDRERFLYLGAKAERLHVTGDIKFHQVFMPTKAAVREMGEKLYLPPDTPILIAGSTHEGEEEMILGVFRGLRTEFPDLLLILAPRHLKRIPKVERILKAEGFSWVRRTSLGTVDHPFEVILLDTIGELPLIYGLGRAIFVGGSFCHVGGHNILEVLAHGKGVVFGPHMENFQEVAALAIAHGAGIQVSTQEELQEALRRLLADPVRNRDMGERGLDILKAQQGALQKTIKAIRDYLGEMG